MRNRVTNSAGPRVKYYQRPLKLDLWRYHLALHAANRLVQFQGFTD